MGDMQRRELIRATGAAGTGLALGAGAASAQQEQTETQQQAVETTFSATVDEGFLVLNGNGPDDQDAAVNIDVSTIDGTVFIEGEVYEDRTWSSTNVDFPELDPTQLVDASDADFIQDIQYDPEAGITVEVNSISGVYDPGAPNGGLVTGDIDLLIDAFMPGTMTTGSGIPIDFTFEFSIDVNSGQDITLTTETSNALDGNASGLNTNSATATVVSNNFTVPKAEGPNLCQDPIVGQICVNELLNLPVEQPTQNWMELTIEPEWDGAPPFAVPKLPGQQESPNDIDGDGKFEDITGNGDVTIFDTQALFTNLDSEEVQNNAKFFNFSQYSDDDEVTTLDVASHFAKHVSGG